MRLLLEDIESADEDLNVVAPGQGIWTTNTRGRYGHVSGTSYATPLVAGIVALVTEARRGNFDPVLINNVLMSTAKPQQDNDAFITVAQQGGGLIDAWEAAHATTFVEPAGLEFNDTEHRVPSIGLKITNTANSDVSYQLSSLAAATMGEPVQATAHIKLSQSSFTLGPGQSAIVNVSADEPSGLDATRLPLWSGCIVIAGDDGSNLTAPYLGLGGSLRSATSLHKNTLEIRYDSLQNLTPLSENPSVVFPDPPSGQRPGSPASIEQFTTPTLFNGNLFFILSLLASPKVLMDIVPLDICPPESSTSPAGGDNTGVQDSADLYPDLSMNCVPSSIVKDSHGLNSIGQVPGFPRYYVSRNAENIEWDGAFAKGQYAPPGRYKIVTRALAVFGDANNPSDWQVTESPVLNIFYAHNYIPLAKPSTTEDNPSSNNSSGEKLPG